MPVLDRRDPRPDTVRLLRDARGRWDMAGVIVALGGGRGRTRAEVAEGLERAYAEVVASLEAEGRVVVEAFPVDDGRGGR